MSRQTYFKIGVLLLCLVLAYVNLQLKLKFTPAWFNGGLEQGHADLLNFNYTNNEQSRLLQFYIPELLVRVFGLGVIKAYMWQRFVFTAATFYLFFLFSRKWFNQTMSLACVVIMAYLMPFTYYNHLQESAALMSLAFLGVLWAIREQKTEWYVLILFIGSINNETMLFLPAVYFFVNFEKGHYQQVIKLISRTVLLALPAFVAVGTIRYINIDRPHLGGAFHFYDNLFMLDRLFMVFNVFWIMAYLKFKKKPLFLQRSLLTIPLFIIPHLITGVIAETRQMLPLSFIVIPSALLFVTTLFPALNRERESAIKANPNEAVNLA